MLYYLVDYLQIYPSGVFLSADEVKCLLLKICLIYQWIWCHFFLLKICINIFFFDLFYARMRYYFLIKICLIDLYRNILWNRKNCYCGSLNIMQIFCGLGFLETPIAFFLKCRYHFLWLNCYYNCFYSDYFLAYSVMLLLAKFFLYIAIYNDSNVERQNVSEYLDSFLSFRFLFHQHDFVYFRIQLSVSQILLRSAF